MMKYSHIFKLSAYASMSAFFLSFFQNADAQIIYVDIDPDLIIDDTGVSHDLDLDGNGSTDFSFLHSSFTFYSPGGDSYRHRIDLLATPAISLNAIAGSYHYHGTFSGGTWWYYPYALPYNTKIDAYDQWQANSSQILALITIDSDDGFILYSPAADWFNSTIEETIDHYLGIRFVDNENKNHYGWIRCDVIDTGRTLIIKDYAYNDTPDNGLYAGTFMSPISSLSNKSNWNIYTFNNVLIIKSEQQITEDTQLNIYNSAGILVYNSLLVNNYSTINLNDYAQGFYIAEVKNACESLTNKIMVSE